MKTTKIKRNPLDFIRNESSRPDPEAKGNVRDGYKKVTFQLKEEYLFVLQKLPFDIREKTGEKPTQIDLVNEAVELLINRYQKKLNTVFLKQAE